MDINVYLEKVTKLPTPHKAGIMAGVVILMLVAYYFFIYLDKQNDLKKVEKKLRAQESELAEKKAIADNLSKFREEVDKLQNKLREALAKLPNESEIDKLLVDIPNLGKESGVTFTKFIPKSEKSRGFFAEVPISIEMTGRYTDLATFFYKLSNLSRIVNVKNIKFTPFKAKAAGDSGRAEEQVTLLRVAGEATTYRFVEQKQSTPEQKKKGR
jgi:type IV pilus assembly protein PilO